MFKVVTSPRAWWPVIFPGVAEDGTIVQNRFKMRFLLLDEDTNKAILEEAAAMDVEEGVTFSKIAADFVHKIACDWSEVVEENDDPMKFTPENVQRLMRIPNVFTAVLGAYRSCRAGKEDIHAGN